MNPTNPLRDKLNQFKEKIARLDHQLRIPGRMLLVILVVVPLALLASLPFFARTSTYPVAVLDGNSMYPSLRNGDMVYYAAPKGPIGNGTIIVFIQGETGVNSLDTLLKPIIIHRVVGYGVEPDGSLYYQTKGDNNAARDPFVTPAASILGVESTVIPYAGLPVQFLKTAYGMLTVASILSLFYFSGVDTRIWEEDERKRLLTVFAKHRLDGSIPADQFERLKLVLECSDIPSEYLTDKNLEAVVRWLKAGGLEEKWTEESAACPNCGSPSYLISGKDEFFTVCPHCMGNPVAENQATTMLLEPTPSNWRSRRIHDEDSFYSSPPAKPQSFQVCGHACKNHHLQCILRRDHPRTHLHTDVGGAFCFFD